MNDFAETAELKNAVRKVQVPLRFSQIYCKTNEIIKDSQRFRVRLGAYFTERLRFFEFGNKIRKDLGIVIDSGPGFYLIVDAINKFPIVDVLDIITVAFNAMGEEKNVFHDRTQGHFYSSAERRKFVDFINQCFSEENLCYRVDNAGIVHLYPDEEFHIQKISTLKCLQAPRYKTVVSEFIKAYDMLDSHPPKTKEAIRAIFDALEILCKLLINVKKGKHSLGEFLIKNKLTPLIKKYYQAFDETVNISFPSFINSFKEWVDGMHWYRHGQNTPEPNDPPIGFTALAVSHGAAYLRWLVEIDQGLMAGSKVDAL